MASLLYHTVMVKNNMALNDTDDDNDFASDEWEFKEPYHIALITKEVTIFTRWKLLKIFLTP